MQKLAAKCPVLLAGMADIFSELKYPSRDLEPAWIELEHVTMNAACMISRIIAVCRTHPLCAISCLITDVRGL